MSSVEPLSTVSSQAVASGVRTASTSARVRQPPRPEGPPATATALARCNGCVETLSPYRPAFILPATRCSVRGGAILPNPPKLFAAQSALRLPRVPRRCGGRDRAMHWKVEAAAMYVEYVSRCSGGRTWLAESSALSVAELVGG